ncbi:Arc/MetJ-type ribon-helix-helix transcriptional regulator [Neorhizobium galegae]|uniref:ribbon-helix-helix domain-containing protein n=1 Tax=Rhizobium/Agrobacterium group TaxID=227290 RepID=UPI001AE29078|nr:ribbon-helix-helix protein, CopG family [Neorhizobium galegae]MBP2548689.1 Arc/MetJ-type ribon-helix-helix transcriptional regulator [Neorhizobium galegae]
MQHSRSFQITLPADLADLLHEKVASGEYASESEVIRQGLLTLAMEDSAVQRWLQDEVAPTYDRYSRDPASASSLDEAMARLDARIAAIEKKPS